MARLTYRHANHHAAASLAFKFAPAPLGVTHDASATRPATSTTAPPCPLPIDFTRRTGRAIADEAVSVPRVVVVVVSSVACLGNTGITRNAATQRKIGTQNRNPTKSVPKSSASALSRTCFAAFFHSESAAGRPGGREHSIGLGNSCITFGSSLNHRVGICSPHLLPQRRALRCVIARCASVFFVRPHPPLPRASTGATSTEAPAS